MAREEGRRRERGGEETDGGVEVADGEVGVVDSDRHWSLLWARRRSFVGR